MYDAAKNGAKTFLFWSGRGYYCWNYPAGKDEFVAHEEWRSPHPIWKICGCSNARSDRMPVADNANNGACKVSYEQNWRRTRFGAEDLARSLENTYKPPWATPKVEAGVITPPTSKLSETDWNENHWRQCNRYRNHHSERSRGTLSTPSGESIHGKWNCKSRNALVLEEPGAS